jgi:hypothetical protein
MHLGLRQQALQAASHALQPLGRHILAWAFGQHLQTSARAGRPGPGQAQVRLGRQVVIAQVFSALGFGGMYARGRAFVLCSAMLGD